MLNKIAIAAAAVAGVSAAETGANPIRRVVTLMQDMQKEIEAEGKKEDDLYRKFKCYCSGNTENLSKAGEEAAAQIEELTAKVKEEKAEKKQLVEELKQHKSDRANAKQDLAKASKIREKEHEAYLAAAGDTKENIDATNQAIGALEKGMAGNSFIQSPVASKLKALIQRSESIQEKMDQSDRETLMNFLQASGDYAPASGQIVGILKNMKDEMDKSLGGIVADEESAAKSFVDLKGAKQKEIALATSAIESKTQRQGELAVSIVQNENAKADATADLDDTQKFLANLSVTCKEKDAEYDVRVKTRNEEIQSISEAISVLNDDDALDVFKASLSKPKAVFLQKDISKSEKAKAILKSIAAQTQKVKNPALMLLTHTMISKLNGLQREGTSVDFSSVIKMVDDMVALLKKEQADDEGHQDWCNGEFHSSEVEQKDTESKVASLESSMSEMADEIKALGEKLANLDAEIKALDKSVAESTTQRKQEHADFTDKVQLNEAAVQLIFKAKNRLQKFYNPDMYKEQKAAAEFVQIAAESEVAIKKHSLRGAAKIADVNEPEPQPETWNGDYQSKGKKSNSVMALMDMLTKELETEIQEAEHDEKTAQKEYAQLLLDAQETRASNVKSVTDKTKAKADMETRLEDEKTKHIVASDQLETVKAYVADLHNSCDFILANFEIRRAARTAEVESLVNAKAVLNGANFK